MSNYQSYYLLLLLSLPNLTDSFSVGNQAPVHYHHSHNHYQQQYHSRTLLSTSTHNYNAVVHPYHRTNNSNSGINKHKHHYAFSPSLSTSYETFGDGALSDQTFTELYSSSSLDKNYDHQQLPTNEQNEETTTSLPKWLTTRCEECGWKYPTIIQKRALDTILLGYDCVIQAQTGSGKTLSYLLPLLASVDSSRAAIQALIVVPTRELGIQVARVARRLAATSFDVLDHVNEENDGDNYDDDDNNNNDIHSDDNPTESSSSSSASSSFSGKNKGKIMIMSVLQGSGNKRQKAWARSEPPHVVIGTPIELSNMVTRGGMKYNAVKFVVIDEVDACLLNNGGAVVSSSSSAALNLSAAGPLHELLSKYLSPTYDEPNGNNDDDGSTKGLLSKSANTDSTIASRIVSHRTDRQTLFVSATIPQHNHFLKQCVSSKWSTKEPVYVCASPGELIPPTLKHVYTVCAGNDQKMGGLKRFIQKEINKHYSDGNISRILIFCDPKRPLEKMAQFLTNSLKLDINDDGSGGEVIVSVLRYEDSTTIRTNAMESFRGPKGGYLGGRIINSDDQQLLEEETKNQISEEIEKNNNEKDSSLRILLSSDLAARGLDIEDISHVINFDLPGDSDTYVHRGGRAGRLGRKGVVMSLITSEQEFVLGRLANKLDLSLRCIARQKPTSSKTEG